MNDQEFLDAIRPAIVEVLAKNREALAHLAVAKEAIDRFIDDIQGDLANHDPAG